MMGYLTNCVLLARLQPETYPDLGNNATLLLATAIANMLLGTYLPLARDKQPILSLTGSVLIIVSSLTAAVIITLGYFHFPMNDIPISLSSLTSIILVLGVSAHLLSNLKPSFISKPQNIPDNAHRETGTVKWFNTSKGFGFIACDQGEDVFIHHRAIRGEGHKTLEEGQRVEFVVMQREKGLQAEDVILISSM